MTDTRGVHRAIERAVQQLGYASLKDEQLKVVVGIAEGRDVFAVLPTGYGKTLCFACLPVVFDQLQAVNAGGSEERSQHAQALVVVVSPLTAIMEDQVYKCTHA